MVPPASRPPVPPHEANPSRNGDASLSLAPASTRSGGPPESRTRPPSQRGGPPLAPTELHALLGAGTSFRGTISFAGRVRIDGSFEGEIHGGELLVVGEGAEIRGHVRADSVIVRGGQVDADIVATRSIELYVPSRVTGTLHSPEIFLDKGVQFSGQCNMSPVDEP